MLILACVRRSLHVNFLFRFFTFIPQVPPQLLCPFVGPSCPLSEQSWGIIPMNAPQPAQVGPRTVCVFAADAGIGRRTRREGQKPGKRELSSLGKPRDFHPGLPFPASLKAAKGANPAHMLGQEAGTSVPSSGGAEDQGGSGCPPRGGLEHWPAYVCLSPGPAEEAQRERPPERAMCPLPEAVRAGPCVL